MSPFQLHNVPLQNWSSLASAYQTNMKFLWILQRSMDIHRRKRNQGVLSNCLQCSLSSFSVIFKTSMVNGHRDILCEFRVSMDDKSVSCESESYPDVTLTQIPHFPFKKGVHFDLLVACERDAFNVSVFTV